MRIIPTATKHDKERTQMDSMVFSKEFLKYIECVGYIYYVYVRFFFFSKRWREEKIIRALHFALVCSSLLIFVFCCFYTIFLCDERNNKPTHGPNEWKPFQVKDPFKHISVLGQVFLWFSLFRNRWLLHIFYSDIHRQARKTIKKNKKKEEYSGINIDCRIEYTQHRHSTHCSNFVSIAHQRDRSKNLFFYVHNFGNKKYLPSKYALNWNAAHT